MFGCIYVNKCTVLATENSKKYKHEALPSWFSNVNTAVQSLKHNWIMILISHIFLSLNIHERESDESSVCWTIRLKKNIFVHHISMRVLCQQHGFHIWNALFCCQVSDYLVQSASMNSMSNQINWSYITLRRVRWAIIHSS